MHTAKWSEVQGKTVTEPGARGCTIRVLMGDNVGAPTFTMRHFEITPGGATPYHTHPWEHEVFVLGGRGVVREKGGESALEAGSFVYVAPDEEHAFVCTGGDPLTFLCVVPAGRHPGQ